LTDLYMERAMFRQQRSGRPNDHRDSLHTTSENGQESGGYEGHVMQSSAYTRAMLSDVGRALPFLALGASVAAAVSATRARLRHDDTVPHSATGSRRDRGLRSATPDVGRAGEANPG
jgi:hypothetical protein